MTEGPHTSDEREGSGAVLEPAVDGHGGEVVDGGPDDLPDAEVDDLPQAPPEAVAPNGVAPPVLTAGPEPGPVAGREVPAETAGAPEPETAGAPEPEPTKPEPATEAEATAPVSKRPPTRQLTTSVLRLANRAHGFLREVGHPALADKITEEAKRWGDASLTVIVAGDIKRGKSSLLNALVGHTDLLPVDADVATSVHLVLTYGPELVVEVTRLDENSEPSTATIDPADLIDVASMKGDEALRTGVTNVDVQMPNQLLQRGLALVDTPGVGGMSRGHRDITMAALLQADALLFAISAQEPVSRTELEFLAEASERIGSVVFVVTKSDLNTDDQNESMLAENRDKLRTHLGQLKEAAAEGDERAAELARRFGRLIDAPFVLTSSFLAEQAARRAAAGREEQAVRYRERSGLDRLEQLVGRSLDTREDVRLANILQLVTILLADVGTEQQDKLRILNDDRSVQEEVAGRKAKLDEFASQQARWRGSLATGIQRLQTEAGRKVARELNVVRNHYKVMIQNAADVESLIAVLPDNLEQSLNAAWTNLSTQANEDFSGILLRLMEDFGLEGLEMVLGDMQMPSGLRDMIDRQGDAGQDFTLLDDGVPLTMQTFTFGNIAGAGLGALGLATGGVGLLAYGIGAAIAFPLMKMRRKQRDKMKSVGEFNRVLNEALFGAEGIAKEFTTELTLRILDTRERIERMVEERLVARRKQLDEQQKELQQLLKSEMTTRGRAKQDVEKVLGDLHGIQQDTDKLRAAVDRSMTSSSGSSSGSSSSGAG